MKKKYYLFLIFILCILDQISKYIVLKTFEVGEAVSIIKDFLRIIFVKNTGISFGMFSDMKMPIIILTIIIIGYMFYEFYKSENKIHLFAVVLIISGAFGNLIDRLLRGYVIDFISFEIMKHEMAIFNMADSFITLGVLIYIYDMFRNGGDDSEKDSSTD